MTERKTVPTGLVARALVCAVGFGGFCAWAALAPLDEGISASGSVVVQNDRQQVQHLEGGIIKEVRVKEGDFVKQDDILIVLQPTASMSERNQIIGSLGHLEASLARLRALRAGATEIDFAALRALELPNDLEAEIVANQNDLFGQESRAHNASRDILTAKQSAARAAAAARENELTASGRALDASRRQLAVTREMLEKRMARINEVEILERSIAGMEAEMARLESERAEALAQAADFGAQVEQLDIERDQKIAADVSEVEVELASVSEGLDAANDVLGRTIIRSPSDGEILNLMTKTVGGVVRPGETIMEVVPENEELIASVRIKPVDRASVRMGQNVRTQLVAYKGWQIPRLEGSVVGLSADLKVDQQTGAPYYEARLAIPGTEATKLNGAVSAPGMPVEAFIFSGSQRTFFEQVIAPLSESLFRGLRQ